MLNPRRPLHIRHANGGFDNDVDGRLKPPERAAMECLQDAVCTRKDAILALESRKVDWAILLVEEDCGHVN